MFRNTEKNSVKTPINECNSFGKTLQFFNTGNLSSLHKQALLIHPEWLNGLNITFKKSIGIDKNIFSDFGVNSDGLNDIQFGFNYNTKNDNDSICKSSTVQFTLNRYEKCSKLFICYQPLSSLRLKFHNQIFAPRIFDGHFNDEKLLSCISSKTTFNMDWIAKRFKWTLSAFKLRDSIATSLTYFVKFTPNLIYSAELNCTKDLFDEKITFEPCFAMAYNNKYINLTGSILLKSSRIDLSFHKEINKNLQAGSFLFIDPTSKIITGSIFCQYNLYDSTLRAKIASNGLIGATYEMKLWKFNVINSIVANAGNKNIIYGLKIGFEI